MPEQNLIAVDLGASSGRVLAGQFDGQKITVSEQFRFSNHPVDLNGEQFWDHLKLFQEIKYGLTIAKKALGRLDSLSVDSWGVDYGLINHQGQVLQSPHSYRDTRTEKALPAFQKHVTPAELFAITGTQPDLIITAMQLFADLQAQPYLNDQIDQVLMIPNLITYFLTGIKHSEFTIASTSGLLTASAPNWDAALMQRLGISPTWFAPVHVGGALAGPLLPAITAELGLNKDFQVVTGAGHDTAAAVLALPIAPADRQRTAFISCGTWSIVGIQTPDADLSANALANGLSNEGCFDGNHRLLANITGLWILQELQKEWSLQGEMVSFGRMTEEATQATTNSFIDPTAAVFATPGDMENKLRQYLSATHQPQPQSRGELLRIVIVSLAMTYRHVLNTLQAETSVTIDQLMMFGGGIQNALLLQCTADYTQLPVTTGPIEASGLGNMVSQLQVRHLLTTEATLAVLQHSFIAKTLVPQPVSELDEQIQRFEQLHQLEADHA